MRSSKGSLLGRAAVTEKRDLAQYLEPVQYSAERLERLRGMLSDQILSALDKSQDINTRRGFIRMAKATRAEIRKLEAAK